ncbi:MAG: hypothetical protein LUF00_01510 [Lachnospiraceae bacterium]|nr:hypothetical protein [Lachnospiraceae bacterium]
MENRKILKNTKDSPVGNLREKIREDRGIKISFSTGLFSVSIIHTECTGYHPFYVDKLSTEEKELSTKNRKVINQG